MRDMRWLMETRTDLRRRLHSRRLVSYEYMSVLLGDNALAYVLDVLDIYKHLFGEVPAWFDYAMNGTHDLEAEIAQALEARFQREPQIVYDAYHQGDPKPLWQPITIIGYGVNTLWVPFEDLDAADQVMVALRRHKLYEHDAEDTHAQIVGWWQAHGYSVPPVFTWPTEASDPVALLAGLRPPLDGLAVLWKVTHRDTGNHFLDYPCWDWDYLWAYDLGWWPETIELLEEHWAAAEPDVERLNAYYDWFRSFDDDQEATRTVLETFEHLEECYGKRPNTRTDGSE